MLEQIRHNRRLHTVIFTVFTALWLVALLSGARVRGLPTNSDTLAIAMHDSLCISEAEGATSSLLQMPLWVDAGVDQDHGSNPHSNHQDPQCLLCIALSPPPAWSLQLAQYPEPVYLENWRLPAHFPPSLQVAAQLPPRGPPVSARV